MNFKAGVPLLLIDASYFIFYRYYATQRWFSFKCTKANPPVPVPEPSSAEFLEAFAKQAKAEIDRLICQWKSCAENTVFCYDCGLSNVWRTTTVLENALADIGIGADIGAEPVPGLTAEELVAISAAMGDIDGAIAVPVSVPSDALYKGTRAAPANFYRGIFPYFYERLERGEMGVGLRRASAERLEADDVVYGIVARLREAGGEAEGEDAAPPMITCISNDNDYLQLLRFPRVRVYNLQDKNLAERSCGCPEKDLLVKILSGDKSDNIPPCARGIGPKTALKVAEMTEAEREAFLRKKGGDAAMTTFARNRQLVDFRHIPADLLQKLTVI